MSRAVPLDLQRRPPPGSTPRFSRPGSRRSPNVSPAGVPLTPNKFTLPTLSELLWRTFKPTPERPYRRAMVYVSLFLIGVSIITITAYILIKLLCTVMGKRVRRIAAARRNEILEGKDAAAAATAVIVGFFHPYCNAGGGGERVLWTAVAATMREYPNTVVAIYTGDVDVSKDEILKRANMRFEINLLAETDRIHIVYLHKRLLVSAARWPRLTLLGQATGSIGLAYEAMCALVPDVFIDTMGYAFTYPLVSMLLNIPVGAYVHYPMISTDMLGKLSLLTQLPKFVYWCGFALLYAVAGAFADVVVANSTWTYQHIRSVWWISRLLSTAFDKSKKLDFQVLYPPCSTTELSALDIENVRQPIVLSIAQFRPEKRHEVILEQFAAFVKAGEEDARKRVSLVLIGSVRDDCDRKRVSELQLLARQLDIEERVEFVLEASWSLTKQYLAKASVGVNAMWNEHFGIGVVEYCAAGLIPVVHASGGPLLDIVIPVDGVPSGFNFTTNSDRDSAAKGSKNMAACLEAVFALSEKEKQGYRQRARTVAQRFSQESFETAWLERMRVLLMLEKYCRVARLRGQRA
ncbi:uncharacterized protein V1518DRAFT_411791 [Limtongia smithiae]|uniref:uncharacterized protein n=1 Tax=Limtongia smithiae TaxID=1125753 RepID=UPI0034CD606C